MKIAMLGLKGIPATFGGVERHVEELSSALAAMGHEITVFVRPSYTSARGRHRGVRLFRLPSIPTKHLDAITHTTLCTMAGLFGSFDIIHYHSVGPALLSFVPRLLGRRVVATVHGMDWKRAKWGPAARVALWCGGVMAAHAPHRTIVVSRALERFLEPFRRRVTWIPNGVETIERRPLRRLRRLGLEEGRYALWMGRFTPEKRCEDMIRAFAELDVDARLVLAGETSSNAVYVEQLKLLARNDPRVIFPGGLYGEDKAEALWNAGVSLLSSELEGLPIAALEAIRCGLCLIGSDIEPMREIVRHGRTGKLYPMGDVDALRSKIEWAFRRPAEAADMGRRAQGSLGRTYDWDHIAEQTVRVYEAARGRGSDDRQQRTDDGRRRSAFSSVSRRGRGGGRP